MRSGLPFRAASISVVSPLGPVCFASAPAASSRFTIPAFP